jgi:hypothetical protein
VRHDFSPPILQAAPKLKFVSFILGLRLEMLLLTILDWTVSGPFWTGLDAKEEGVTRAGGVATAAPPAPGQLYRAVAMSPFRASVLRRQFWTPKTTDDQQINLQA